MRNAAIASIMLSLVVSPDAFGSRPKCPDIRLELGAWVEKKLADADVVFLGKVISAEIPEPIEEIDESEVGNMEELLDRIRNPDPNLVAHLYQITSFEIVKSWKGVPGPIIVTSAHLVYGAGPFEIGKIYLVFGYKDQDIRIYSVPTACRSAFLADEASERMAILDELTEVP